MAFKEGTRNGKRYLYREQFIAGVEAFEVGDESVLQVTMSAGDKITLPERYASKEEAEGAAKDLARKIDPAK